MDTELIVVRLIHIVPGTMWVGMSVFAAFILEPRLKVLGPELAAETARSINKIMGPILLVLGLVTIGAGFSVLARTPGRDSSELFDTDWGWAIGVGVIASMVSFILGFATGAIAIRVGRIRSAGGDSPTSEQIAQLARLSGLLSLFGKLAALGTVIAVGAMASARFV